MRTLVISSENSGITNVIEHLNQRCIVDSVTEKAEWEFFLLTNLYDLILISETISNTNSFILCREIVKKQPNSKIVFGMAGNCVEHLVEAYECGADYLLIPPYNINLIIARLDSIIRKIKRVDSLEKSFGSDYKIKLNTKQVFYKESEVLLKRKEYDLLECLVRNQGITLTRDALHCKVWKNNFDIYSNTLDVHIKSLRDKLEKPYNTKFIKTVYRFGYRIE